MTFKMIRDFLSDNLEVFKSKTISLKSLTKILKWKL